MDNIGLMQERIGKRMPKELIDFDDPDLKDKSGSFSFEMQSEFEFERNFERIERAEERSYRDDSDDEESDEESEDEDYEDDDDDLGGYDEPILATIFLTVYADEDGNVSDYEVDKNVDAGEGGRSEEPDESEIDDVLDLFLSLYEEEELK